MATTKDRLVRHLTGLANRRSTGTVTSDDAQRILNRWHYTGNRNLIGGVLRRNFKSVGYTRSAVDSNKSRTIRVWSKVS